MLPPAVLTVISAGTTARVGLPLIERERGRDDFSVIGVPSGASHRALTVMDRIRFCTGLNAYVPAGTAIVSVNERVSIVPLKCEAMGELELAQMTSVPTLTDGCRVNKARLL
jgi:hypothetical protein